MVGNQNLILYNQKDLALFELFLAEEELLGIIFDIFVAGSETTSHTLGFALLFMIIHPHIQNKVQEEIDEVLQGRPPSLTDRGR
jgi:cytochrome P450